jgi:hypothetical protein
MKVELSSLDVQCVTWIFMIVALGATLAGCELLYIWKEYDDQGLFSWPVVRSSYRFALKSKFRAFLDALFGYPQYLYLPGLQIVFALALLLDIFPHHRSYFLLAMLLIHLLSTLRNPQGSDGTDQMQTILLAALVCYYATPNPIVKKAVIWFISLQAILAYFTSGIAKLLSKPWREGTVLKNSLLLAPGNKTLYQWLPKNARLNQFLCLSVVVFECAFPLALIGPKMCLAFLAGGVLLHIFNAVALSLPRFLFTFVAAYPAILASAGDLHPGALNHLF